MGNSNFTPKRNNIHKQSGGNSNKRSPQNNRGSNHNKSNKSNRPAQSGSRAGKTNRTTNKANRTNGANKTDSTAFFGLNLNSNANLNFNTRANNIRPVSANVSRMANMALPRYSAGAVDYPGRLARRRVRAGDTEQQKFYNTRKHIITGNELTTPLRKRGLAAAEAKTDVKIKVTTIKVTKKTLPISAIFNIVIVMGVCLFLIFSKMMLNEYTVNISNAQSRIATAQRDESYIMVQLEMKDDLFEFEKRAIELGMIKEDTLPKKYLSLKNKDRVEILGGNDSVFTKLTDILPQIFSDLSGK